MTTDPDCDNEELKNVKSLSLLPLVSSWELWLLSQLPLAFHWTITMLQFRNSSDRRAS